ncbi:SDR family oxidoreductase [Rhizobium sp. BK251]|uniref:SDR family NAD(P)-dependent oxidoreductase n=1 Tax=Rhizobium sp. BK251 TaxID=2512125 RepID=UPI001052972F|nr:SDR family oxidoreductase [Rhizobium sp. BK251]TCL62947.1 NAD(P)-dependent dehydrogenase (short-subunit alcohol dehydrogenase family) [Rhizobium sp. BK251]
MAGKLVSKIALVTGGSTGIGLATAQAFVEEGAYVFITGRRQEYLDRATAQIGRNVRAIQGDVTKSDDLAKLFDVIATERGKLDVIVANAGAGDFAPLGQITEEFYNRQIDLNLRGVLFTVQGALPMVSNGASIIIIGSMAGSKGVPGMTVYGAAKAAVRSFARTWTLELKDRQIRTNILSPGPILTGPLESAPPEVFDQFLAGIPMGRVGLPAEIANSAVFLASDDSRFITGVELFADGGAAQV